MKDNMKKIKKYVKIIKFAAAAATVAMAIYTLIPKSEKIQGIDTLPLETLGNGDEQKEEEAIAK